MTEKTTPFTRGGSGASDEPGGDIEAEAAAEADDVIDRAERHD